MLQAQPNPQIPHFLKGLAHAKNLLLDLRKHKKQQPQFSPISKKHTKFSTSLIPEESAINQGHSLMETSQMPSDTKPSQPIKNEIQIYEDNINKIGKQLEKVHNDIQSYEIIFDHLCDYYSANKQIELKHNRIKKDNIKIQEEKQKYEKEIVNLKQKIQQIHIQEKTSKNFIKQAAEEYVREVLAYNNQQFCLPSTEIDRKYDSVEDDWQQEEYNELDFSYKEMAVQKREYNKKRNLLEPKKMSKGISFEQELDMTSKYYESQLNDI